jgi:hypothetical protein
MNCTISSTYAERLEQIKVRTRVRLGDRRYGLPSLDRALDQPIVDVGHILHVEHAPSLEAFEVTSQRAEHEDRADVSDVQVVVDGGATDVDPHGLAVLRCEGIQAPREAVVELQGPTSQAAL